MLYALASEPEAKFSLSFFDNSRKDGCIAVWLRGPAQIDWATSHFNSEFFWVAEKSPEDYSIVSPWRKIRREAFIFLVDGKVFIPQPVSDLLDQFAI